MSVDIERKTVYDKSFEGLPEFGDEMPPTRTIIEIGDDGFAHIEQRTATKKGNRSVRIGLHPDMLAAIRTDPFATPKPLDGEADKEQRSLAGKLLKLANEFEHSLRADCDAPPIGYKDVHLFRDAAAALLARSTQKEATDIGPLIEALQQIRDMKPSEIAPETHPGIVHGPQLLLNNCQRIARKVLAGLRIVKEAT